MTKEKKKAKNQKNWEDIKKSEAKKMQKSIKKSTDALGRPSEYTDEIGDEICSRIAEGESLVSICKDTHMPSAVTVYAWLRAVDGFLKRYTTAREDQADTLIDEMKEIVDSEMPVGIDGKIDGGAVSHAKLRAETRKWAASKLKPKKYGEFNRTEITGKDGDALAVKTVFIEKDDKQAMLKHINKEIA